MIVGSATKVTLLYKGDEYSPWCREMSIDLCCGELGTATLRLEYDLQAKKPFEVPQLLKCYIKDLQPRLAKEPPANEDEHQTEARGVILKLIPAKVDGQTEEWFTDLLPRIAVKLPKEAMSVGIRWASREYLEVAAMVNRKPEAKPEDEYLSTKDTAD